MRGRRNEKGSPIVEATCGGLMIVLVAVFMLNAVPMILASQMMAKATCDAARAAASQSTAADAKQAAQATLRNSGGAGFLSHANIVHMDYNATSEAVTITAQVHMPVPAPIPLVPNCITLKSAASQPLLAKPPRGA